MDDQPKVIDVRGLTKKFGEITAVNHIDLCVEQGQIFGFLGPNGSGKTTTIRMLCGLLTPDDGSGTCLGYDVIKESDAIKSQVGYMSQKFTLYEDLSIYENLNFIADIYEMKDLKNQVKTALKELGLYQRRHQLAGQLSGGWKQRLALAAALLHKPKLLLLDEPTAGVDPKARREFWDQIHFLATTGITTLVSTHYMDEAARCNRLAYIIKGQILLRGTEREIISRSHIHTWEVRGPKLAHLAQDLKAEGIDQVISYGDTLHVSSKQRKKLTNIAQKHSRHFDWQEIEASLEDVFINLTEPEDRN